MSERDSIDLQPRVRRDGWTPERQLRFLDVLGRTRSVTKAARAAGMSRESAYRLSEIETKKISPTMLAFYEWKWRPDLTLRVEAVTFNQRNVKRIREVYAGSRATAPIDYVDVRDLEWQGHLLIKLRKSFGG